MAKDFLDIIFQCIAAVDSSALLILLALALGALCWVACSYYTRLWHKRFHMRTQHHVLCAIAAVLTAMFTVTFRAVANLEYIANEIIEGWSENLVNDNVWNSQTYGIAFYAVKVRFPDQFGGIPEPGRQDSYIPFNNDAMMQLCVKTYVNEARNNFSTHRPFLDRMLRARPGISEEEIQEDIHTFFRNNPGQRYPLSRAVSIAAAHIREGLLIQSPKTVWKTRLILVFLFLGVQLIPFGTITYCASKDLDKGEYLGKEQEDLYF